jgi:hypothetical protein
MTCILVRMSDQSRDVNTRDAILAAARRSYSADPPAFSIQQSPRRRASRARPSTTTSAGSRVLRAALAAEGLDTATAAGRADPRPPHRRRRADLLAARRRLDLHRGHRRRSRFHQGRRLPPLRRSGGAAPRRRPSRQPGRGDARPDRAVGRLGAREGLIAIARPTTRRCARGGPRPEPGRQLVAGSGAGPRRHVRDHRPGRADDARLVRTPDPEGQSAPIDPVAADPGLFGPVFLLIVLGPASSTSWPRSASIPRSTTSRRTWTCSSTAPRKPQKIQMTEPPDAATRNAPAPPAPPSRPSPCARTSGRSTPSTAST